MGLRGIGAKPKARRDLEKTPQRRARPWAARGLTRAERVIAFIGTLKITSGPSAGRKFRLRDWQKKIVRAIYRERAGKRLIRMALLTMGRKNGKTQLAAALALCHLAGPEAESRGQVFSAGADRDQAALIFAELVAFIDADMWLAAECNVVRFSKRIEHMPTGSIYQALSSDARKAHGLSPSFFIYDEIAQAPDRHLFDNLRTGGGGRAEPLGIVISTQSRDPLHVMSELVDYGNRVLNGAIDDPTFLPIIHTVPMSADIWDENNWPLANPALGDFRSLEDMRIAAAQAKRMPAAEATFRNLYLNQPVDPVVHFLAPRDWAACGGAVDPESLRGAECWAGLDLSHRQDLTALVVWFPKTGTALSWFWLPEEGLREKEDRDRAQYTTWRRQGHLEVTPGRVVDVRAVMMRCAEILSAFNVQGIAHDRWRIEELRRSCADEGIDLPLEPWGQGFKDQAPGVDALEAAVLNRKLKHGDQPVLNYCASNAVLETDPAGNRKITKEKSRGRVDGLVALASAMGLANRQEAKAPGSVPGALWL